jgi:hypothetical protein
MFHITSLRLTLPPPVLAAVFFTSGGLREPPANMKITLPAAALPPLPSSSPQRLTLPSLLPCLEDAFIWLSSACIPLASQFPPLLSSFGTSFALSPFYLTCRLKCRFYRPLSLLSSSSLMSLLPLLAPSSLVVLQRRF